MRTYLDCYACFLRQALDAARLSGADEQKQRTVVERVLQLLLTVDPASTPPAIAHQVHRLVRAETASDDPYRVAKEQSTRQALALYPRLKEFVANAADPLEVAIRLSIAGNIIDLGAAQSYDLWGTVERVLTQPFAIDDRPAFRSALEGSGPLLILADNAGETVFDRVLIETLDRPAVYAVKGGAIINDATMTDARAAGLDRVAELVSNGSDAPGTSLGLCSDSFRQLYTQAQLVIAKGQANYETLSDQGDQRLFFLLQIKCPVIGRDAGAPAGSIVLMQG